MRTREIPGPYQLLELLGQGGMGSVYLAHDPRLDRRVAVKRIADDADPSRRQRFRREAATLARLQHPSIVQIFDLVETDDGDWIVMELVEGPTLKARIADGPLTPAMGLAIGRRIAEGLAEAHAQGVLHRDLKTENVILDRRGERSGDPHRIKIVDFGLAKSLAADDDETSLSRSGQMLGTIRAMAPEQVRGLSLDPRTDLFALGVLLYEILTGTRPFHGAQIGDTLDHITRRPHVPARAWQPAIPPAASALIDRLLEKSPDLRPASARAVADRLAALEDEARRASQAGAEATAETETAAYPPDVDASTIVEDASSVRAIDARPQRRGPRVAIAIAALLAVITAGWLMRDARDPAPAAPVPDPPPSAEANPDPDGAYAHFEDGMRLLERFDKADHLDRAVAAFGAAIASNPRSAPAHAGLALAHRYRHMRSRNQASLDRAFDAARRAVTLDGYLALARIALGSVHAAAGRFDEAKGEFETAILLDPSNARAHGEFARALSKENRRDEALTRAIRAVALAPDDRALRDLLGTLYFQTARYDEAEAQFRASVALAPDGIYGYRNLAAVLY
ncbi:MAG: protein kinase, partial [Acidobacteriota bacterium]